MEVEERELAQNGHLIAPVNVPFARLDGEDLGGVLEGEVENGVVYDVVVRHHQHHLDFLVGFRRRHDALNMRGVYSLRHYQLISKQTVSDVISKVDTDDGHGLIALEVSGVLSEPSQ